ncbi:MAG: GspE/PulE family protein [Steroidobacteraceae bacterium]
MAEHVSPSNTCPAVTVDGDDTLASLSGSFARQAKLCLTSTALGRLHLYVTDTPDESAIAELEFALDAKFDRIVVSPEALAEMLDRLYPIETADEASALDASGVEGANDWTGPDDVDALRDLASEAPVVRWVQELIANAVSRKASDIHIEPSDRALAVRYRIDGMLQDIDPPPAQFRSAVVSRIKILANLNIAEQRLPQDGRLRLTITGRETDFRVATAPTVHGESVVLRVLDREEVALDFEALGFSPDAIETFRSALAKPYGILLATGPTGSGKTTTLYAALKALNRRERKILTVEDPVEYTLIGVNQSQVKPQIGYTFANALRSFLRQDPDIMMVGEIRDRETAEVAVQAALTGHLLLSTLHTNTAAAAVTRLLDMGVEPFLLTSTLHLIVGQRLVRKLCTACRAPYDPTPAELRELPQLLTADATEAPQLHRPVGCTACRGTGYAARTTLSELLVMTDSIGKLILARADASTIQARAVDEGMTTMLQDGLRKAQAGVTSLEEVLRVTRAE